jgi:hypothetical protein
MTWGRFTERWPEQSGFIVAGGPSVNQQPIERLRGRPVIAINSAIRTVPFADILYFNDARWWSCPDTGTSIGRDLTAGYRGKIYTGSAAVICDRVTRLRKRKPPAMPEDDGQVSGQWSAVSAALCLMLHAGVKTAVVLGVDGTLSADGRRHNHGEPYPWPLLPDAFERQADEFSLMAPLFAARGLEILNASPVSSLTCWRKVTLERVLQPDWSGH